MGIRLRHKTDGTTMEWETISLRTGVAYSDEYERFNLPSFITRDYEVILSTTTISSKTITPNCGWENLTLENFEEVMGYRYRIDTEQSMRGISRELAFLEFLESKGVSRKSKLVEGLTLENFKEKIGQRFRMRKEDKARGLSRQRAFEEWLKMNGYN